MCPVWYPLGDCFMAFVLSLLGYQSEAHMKVRVDLNFVKPFASGIRQGGFEISSTFNSGCSSC
ncbi:hypothetical protein M758_4G115300 [Ceratodon purpureus]|uniref:Uncharacterized protein n=1 Tax=Ceratodon purpureus TaxID=3225 RepID=A0A8T0I9P1_CERPU|nr:hypothetical protein KC19_4G115400 [Ceratodon purpureus]KAG0619085.1 hypothetical protein M758_4G115300 [Ceratodon purpureus]